MSRVAGPCSSTTTKIESTMSRLVPITTISRSYSQVRRQDFVTAQITFSLSVSLSLSLSLSVCLSLRLSVSASHSLPPPLSLSLSSLSLSLSLYLPLSISRSLYFSISVRPSVRPPPFHPLRSPRCLFVFLSLLPSLPRSIPPAFVLSYN